MKSIGTVLFGRRKLSEPVFFVDFPYKRDRPDGHHGMGMCSVSGPSHVRQSNSPWQNCPTG